MPTPPQKIGPRKIGGQKAGAWRSLPSPIRSATFRFVVPPRFHLLRAPAAHALLKTMTATNTNTDAAKATPSWRIRSKSAGDTPPPRRTAEKRLPLYGEMEHVHGIYGGIFADGSDSGSA